MEYSQRAQELASQLLNLDSSSSLPPSMSRYSGEFASNVRSFLYKNRMLLMITGGVVIVGGVAIAMKNRQQKSQ